MTNINHSHLKLIRLAARAVEIFVANEVPVRVCLDANLRSLVVLSDVASVEASPSGAACTREFLRGHSESWPGSFYMNKSINFVSSEDSEAADLNEIPTTSTSPINK